MPVHGIRGHHRKEVYLFVCNQSSLLGRWLRLVPVRMGRAPTGTDPVGKHPRRRKGTPPIHPLYSTREDVRSPRQQRQRKLWGEREPFLWRCCCCFGFRSIATPTAATTAANRNRGPPPHVPFQPLPALDRSRDPPDLFVAGHSGTGGRPRRALPPQDPDRSGSLCSRDHQVVCFERRGGGGTKICCCCCCCCCVPDCRLRGACHPAGARFFRDGLGADSGGAHTAKPPPGHSSDGGMEPRWRRLWRRL
mmetsp:Transcript_9138/g.27163  ORF Transcript_9138/g.27163 Transcript_9138/m.27163 type:complete len:249 (-) Transcript_9138:388-1134(-)